MFMFFLKQKKAYEMRISDWSSDVCSSDLGLVSCPGLYFEPGMGGRRGKAKARERHCLATGAKCLSAHRFFERHPALRARHARQECRKSTISGPNRSAEHTSELQSLMRTSYAVFCLKKNKHTTETQHTACCDIHE